MSRKGDNIRKRSDGRWEGRYRKGRTETGKIIYGSVYGKTYREVKDKMIEKQSSLGEESKQSSKTITFSRVLWDWLNINKVHQKGATTNRYRNLITSHIEAKLGKHKIQEINSSLINSFLAEKLKSGRLDGKGGLSPSYVRSIAYVIDAALEYAVNADLCKKSRIAILKPQLKKDELPILNSAEQDNLVSAMTNNISPTNIGILISLYAGLRIGEICALRWSDIDLGSKIIHIRHTVARVSNDDPEISATSKLILDEPKTLTSKRDIPIASFLVPLLHKVKSSSCSEFVVSENKKFVSPRTYDYRYHKILENCKITPYNYHTLRHTFATRCVEAGVDIKSLSEILGHSNVSITLNTYIHSSMEQKRIQIEKLAVGL